MFENFENSFFITVQLYTKKEQLRLLSHGFVLKIVEKTIIRKFACNFWKYYRKVGFIIKKNTFYTEILILWIMIIFCSHKNMCYYIQFKFFKKKYEDKKILLTVSPSILSFANNILKYIFLSSVLLFRTLQKKQVFSPALKFLFNLLLSY